MRKNTKDQKMLDYMEALVEFADDQVAKHELNSYIPRKGKVDTDKIESSEDITAEQVAILGGYLMVHRAYDALSNISKGEEAKPISSKPTSTMSIQPITISVDKDTGKVEVMGSGELPDEVIEAMKRIIERHEDE